jgi:AsmA protein
MKGRLKAEKLKLVSNGTPAGRPVELDFDEEHTLKTGAGRLRKGDIHIGQALATLAGAYSEQHAETTWRLNLSGPNMPVPELAAILPAIGIVLPAGSSLKGGTMSVKLAMEGPAARLVMSGPVTLENTTLAGFDLGRKMAVIERLAGIQGGPNTEIQRLRTDLRLSPEGIRADGIEMVVPAIGQLSGGGAVSADRALDFKMTAKVHTSGMMSAISDAPIPFLVGGSATDPVFRPDVRAVVSQEMKTQGTKAVQGLLNRFLGGKKN